MASNGADVFRETTLEMPADFVRKCPGLSMDVGGSVVKIVYRDKDDWEALQKDQTASHGKLRLLSVSRTLLLEAVQRVKQRVYLTPAAPGAEGSSQQPPPPTDIYTCGIGCSQFGPTINQELNVKLSNIMEMDCFARGFSYLVQRHPASQLLHPPCQQEIGEATAEIEKTFENIKTFKTFSSMKLSDAKDANEFKEETTGHQEDIMASDKPLAEVLDGMFPCLTAMSGSAFGYIKIDADGAFTMVDYKNNGGRTLLGLGSLLTGAKTYDELIDLAEKGRNFAVDMSNKAFELESRGEEEDKADSYKKLMNNQEERLVFCLGHAVGKTTDDFRREDLAAAAVNLSVVDSVITLLHVAQIQRLRHVFVCGGYTTRPYMRRVFTLEWTRRVLRKKFFTNMENAPLPELHFMSVGSHLGAIGAMLNNVDNFINKDGLTVKKE